jgi:hypothetical protein
MKTFGVETRCDFQIESFTEYYNLLSYDTKVSQVKRTVDGVTTYDLYEYKENRSHHNPIKEIYWTDGLGSVNDPERVVTHKYVEDMPNSPLLAGARQRLLDRNVVSIPIETLVDNGEHSGVKSDYDVIEIGNVERVVNTKTYRRDGADWTIVKEIVDPSTDINSEGLIESIKTRGQILATEYEYEYGLLSKRKHGIREVSYTYDNLRRLRSTTNALGVESRYVKYDGFNRVLLKSDRNGSIVTEKTYVIDPSDDEVLTTTVSYPSSSPRLPSGTTETRLLPSGKTSSSLELGYTQGGTDFGVKYRYDAVGRLERKCSSSAGCIAYYYEDSPLSRTLESQHLSAPNPVSMTYGSNGETIDGYPAHTLLQQSSTDQDGQTVTSYKDRFGKTIASDDGLGYRTLYKYNAQDLIEEVIPPGSSPGNADLNYTYTYYDNRQEHTASIPGKGMHTSTYGPDHDELKTETLPNGATMSYTYHPDYLDFVEMITKDGEAVQYNYPYYSDLLTSWVGASETSVLDGATITGNMLSSTVDYDLYGRATTTTTQYLDGQSTAVVSHDAMDNVRLETTTHVGPDGASHVVRRDYEYDRGLRLESVVGNYPGVGKIKLADYQ